MHDRSLNKEHDANTMYQEDIARVSLLSIANKSYGWSTHMIHSTWLILLLQSALLYADRLPVALRLIHGHSPRPYPRARP